MADAARWLAVRDGTTSSLASTTRALTTVSSSFSINLTHRFISTTLFHHLPLYSSYLLHAPPATFINWCVLLFSDPLSSSHFSYAVSLSLSFHHLFFLSLSVWRVYSVYSFCSFPWPKCFCHTASCYGNCSQPFMWLRRERQPFCESCSTCFTISSVSFFFSPPAPCRIITLNFVTNLELKPFSFLLWGVYFSSGPVNCPDRLIAFILYWHISKNPIQPLTFLY